MVLIAWFRWLSSLFVFVLVSAMFIHAFTQAQQLETTIPNTQDVRRQRRGYREDNGTSLRVLFYCIDIIYCIAKRDSRRAPCRSLESLLAVYVLMDEWLGFDHSVFSLASVGVVLYGLETYSLQTECLPVESCAALCLDARAAPLAA